MQNEPEFVVFARGAQVINAGIFASRVRATQPIAVTCLIDYSARPNGLPNDVGYVYKIEDKLGDALAPIGAVFVGHVLEAGRCRTLFYARQAAEPVVRVKIGLLKSIELSLDSREDPEWSLYESEILPTYAERAIARSQPLFSTLRQHGDCSEVLRTVDLAVLFPDVAQRGAFKGELASADPSIRIGNEWTDDQNSFWLELHKDMGTDEASIGSTGGMLMELAERHGGSFDGWACPVMK